MKILLVFFLLCTYPHQAEDCFNLLYTSGLKAYNNRQFSTALQKFTAARDCPEKNKASDLEAWIGKSQQGLRERQAWNKACRFDSYESYQHYLDNYAQGYYADKAKIAQQRLQKMAAQPVQENTPTGTINWTQEWVEASGQCAIDLKQFPDNEARAILMATRGAELVSKANLLETAEGVHVHRSTTIRDLITGNDIIKAEVEGVVKGARGIGQPIVANGLVTVTMRMPIYGAGSISGAFNSKRQPSPFLKDEMPDSTAEELVIQLLAGSSKPNIYPTIVDAKGNTLLDGPASTGQMGEPVVRYIRSEDVPLESRTIAVQEDASGRWVLPNDALASFQTWLNLKAANAEVLPIRVVF